MTPRSPDGGHGPEPTVSAWIQLLWGLVWVAGGGGGLEMGRYPGWPGMVEKKWYWTKESGKIGSCWSQAFAARLGPMLKKERVHCHL